MSEQRRNTVGVLGAGGFGTAISQLIASRGRSVFILSSNEDVATEINTKRQNKRSLPAVTLHEGISATTNDAELAEACRFIIVAVTSTEVAARLAKIGAKLGGQHILVHAVGALSLSDEKRISEVIEEKTPVRRIGVMAGPSLPSDLVGDQVSSMVVASRFDEVTQEAHRLIAHPPKLRMYRSSDLIGVELASILASAYTLAIGMASALQIGASTHAVLVTRIVAEASRLLKAAGAEERTFAGLSGLGNLLVRAARADVDPTPSIQYGRSLVDSKKFERPAREPEGVRAARAGVRLAAKFRIRVPVLEAVATVLDGGLPPEKAAALIARSVADEE